MAAAWHAERGLADEAIRHALAAGELNQAADLVERHFDAVYFTGENATVQRWLSGLYPDKATALYIHAKALVADAGRSGQRVLVGS